MCPLGKERFWPIRGNSSILFFRTVGNQNLYERLTDLTTLLTNRKHDITVTLSCFPLIYVGVFPDQYSWLWSLRSPIRVDLAADIAKEIKRALHTRRGRRDEAAEAGRRMSVKIFCTPAELFVLFHSFCSLASLHSLISRTRSFFTF